MNITLSRKAVNHSHSLVENQGRFDGREVEVGVALAGATAAFLAYKALSNTHNN
jgi:hypothetical protein